MINKTIDAHVHIWDLELGSYKWLENDTSILNRTYSFDELLPDFEAAKITECILVQADNTLDDTQRMLEAARLFPQVVGVVGWLPLTDPDKLNSLLADQFLQEPYFKGVRHLIHNEADPKWLLQANVIQSLRILSDYGIPFDVVGTTSAHLETVLELAQQIPDLRMVLDHLNQPPVKTAERYGDWGSLISEAAKHENIYGKISGLGTTTGKSDWTKADIQPYIAYVLNTFGTERCFCGGDWPVALLGGSYTYLWETYREILTEELSPDEEQLVLYQNAKNFYKV